MRLMIGVLCVALILPTAVWAEDYWQQRTHYTIDAEFIPDSNLIVGTTDLRYWNQSPDDLTEVYFHLYNNAWKPGSYLDRMWQQYNYRSIIDAPPSDWGGMDFESMTIAGRAVELRAGDLDNTIMRIPLIRPLRSGDSLDFSIRFRCKIPGARWRNGGRGDHYDIAQWYPRIGVYDRKGWNTQQKLGTGEFYGEFGDYDVTLRAPEAYIIAHTGTLVNEAELFPGLPSGSADTILVDILGELEQAKDTADSSAGDEFADAGTAAAEVPADTMAAESPKMRTWVMHAENVIDFAMGADPQFVWDRTRTKDGVLIDCFYSGRAKRNWKRNGAEFTRFAIETFSEKIGSYPYPRYSLVSSHFGGGVEYPMLTFVSARASHIPSHGLFDVTAHEVAHCWFYGILASNEIEEAFLDEGFTQFATAVAIEEYFGRWDNNITFESRADSVYSDADDERSGMQRSYLRMRSRMQNEPPLATSSDQWPGRWVYATMVYDKTATVLYALMDVLGEDKFWECMHHYYDRWSFKHPRREDLYASFNECSGQNLSWFWEQWFEQGWTIDFALDDVRFADTDSGRTADLTVSRHGQGMAPVTVRFEYDDGTHVDRRLGLKPWRGMLTRHTFRVTLPASASSKVSRVVLDPDLHIPDLNRTNNYSGMMPVEARFVPPEVLYPDRRERYPLDRQRVNHQPRLWYNEYDGVELGYYASNSWLGLGHRWDAMLMVGTESGKIDWWVGHSEIWEGLSRKAEWGLQNRRRDGRWDAELFATYSLAQYYWQEHDVRVAYRIGDAHGYVDEYGHAQSVWERGLWSEFEFRYRRPVERRYSDHALTAWLRTSGVGSEFDYQHGELKIASTWELPNLPEFETRFYASMLGGTPPFQRRPGIATGSGMDYFEDAYYRSAGTLPAQGINEAHIFRPGGGHLHGYLSETPAAPDNLVTFSAFHETSWLSKWTPDGVPLLSRNLQAVRPGFFADVGAVWNNSETLGDARGLADAGVVLSYHVPYQWFERLFGDRPVRAYFPLWVSDPVSGDAVDFRWQLSFTEEW